MGMVKICLKLQIPYYQPLNCWLLGATTSGNQRQTMMHTPLYTPMHESHLLRVPTTANEIIGIDQPN